MECCKNNSTMKGYIEIIYSWDSGKNDFSMSFL